jgi:hypothetical protein
MKKCIQTINGFFAKPMFSFLAKFRKPKLEVKLKHIVHYSDGTSREISEDEAPFKVTIKRIK